MAQQTAVNWLIEQLKQVYDKEGKLPLVYTFELLRQAKQMEREQIIGSYEQGVADENEGNRNGQFTNAEKYYNETYCEYSGLPSVKFYEEKEEGGR